MPCNRKTCEKDTGKKRRVSDKNLDNVISMRISDYEKKLLEKIVKRTSKNVSDIMRDAMNSWMNNRNRLCLD